MILYEDKDIIVCHKMAGIAVQSARIGEKDLVSMLNNSSHGAGGPENGAGAGRASVGSAGGRNCCVCKE